MPDQPGPHTLVAALLDVADPHRDHEYDQVNAFPHPPTCLTCSNEETGEEVEYFRLDIDDDTEAFAACQVVKVLRAATEIVGRRTASWPREQRQIADLVLGMFLGLADEVEHQHPTDPRQTDNQTRET